MPTLYLDIESQRQISPWLIVVASRCDPSTEPLFLKLGCRRWRRMHVAPRRSGPRRSLPRQPTPPTGTWSHITTFVESAVR